MQCPECGSHDVVNRTITPDYAPYDPDEAVSYWECGECGATWRDDD